MMQHVHESLERHHVELLVAFRHTGKLATAAKLLHISASAASHRLQEAERRLGVELTTAEGRSIRLTQAGLHLAEVGEIAQNSLRSAEEQARWMNSADRPAVRIALDFYDTAPWFEDLVGVADLPTDVDFLRVGYDQTRESVERRIADLGVVVVAAAAPPGDVLAEDFLVGIVPSQHPAANRGQLQPHDIVDVTYVTAGDRPTHGFEHHEFFEPAGVRPHRLRKVESLAMVLRLMRTFGGMTVQPRLAIPTRLPNRLSVVPLSGPRIWVRWEFVVRSDANDNARSIVEAVRGLIDRRTSDPIGLDAMSLPGTPTSVSDPFGS